MSGLDKRPYEYSNLLNLAGPRHTFLNRNPCTIARVVLFLARCCWCRSGPTAGETLTGIMTKTVQNADLDSYQAYFGTENDSGSAKRVTIFFFFLEKNQTLNHF